MRIIIQCLWMEIIILYILTHLLSGCTIDYRFVSSSPIYKFSRPLTFMNGNPSTVITTEKQFSQFGEVVIMKD